jgi:hypothetical protein
MANQPEVNLASEILNNLAMVSEIVSHLTPFDLPNAALINKTFGKVSRAMINHIIKTHINVIKSNELVIRLYRPNIVKSKRFALVRKRVISHRSESVATGKVDLLTLIIKYKEARDGSFIYF